MSYALKKTLRIFKFVKLHSVVTSPTALFLKYEYTLQITITDVLTVLITIFYFITMISLVQANIQRYNKFRGCSFIIKIDPSDINEWMYVQNSCS